ncbi:hypothetical protein [Flavobacterium sp. W22_SRS_FP1]|uniref:hypothetical protein n=1 Tax=Flavobacterium sp. W22_SRS_FP1 TaxID=3240276 RepID=UPI003F8FE149
MFKLFKKSPNLKSILEKKQAEYEPLFIGSKKEFNKYFSGYGRNLVQTITKSHKKSIGKCEHCGTSDHQLEAAHVKGNDRKDIIDRIISKFESNGIIEISLHFFEQEFIVAHNPIKETIKILCKSCHREYDNVPATAIKAKESPMVSIANYYEAARLEFRKKVIEQLSERDKFTIFITSTNEASTMSKQEFYDTFNNVASSDSYKIKGTYSYTKTPQKTYKYISNSSERSKLNNISNLKIAKHQIPAMTKDEAIKPSKQKIGKYVQETFKKNLAKIDATELTKLQNAEYCKTTFDIQYPLLKKVIRSDSEKPERYWKDTVEILGAKYWLCSEWYEKKENNDRPYYDKWLKKIGHNYN